MNSKDIKNLYEAYSAVYDEELRNELEEMTDEFAGIEELTEEEIDAIVENTIFEMIAEGYEFDEVEEIFEEVLSEGRVDMAARAAARREYARSSEKAASQARRAGASVVRREKRAEKIAQVKGAVKSTLSRAKEAAKSGVAKAKEAGREAKFQAVDKPVADYATKRGLHPGAGLAARSKDPEKRRGLRAKVASDIKSRIGGKIRGAVEKARTLGAGAASAAASAPEAARQAGSDVKSSVKGRIGRAALGVAKRMGVAEEVDLYDVVLEHLLAEGFAETEEAATVIMANMSEEWRDEILDEGFKRMDRAKIERQARRLGGDRGDVLRAVAGRMDTEVERKYSTSQARKNRAGAGSEYRKAQELRARDDAKADFKKYGLR